MATYKRTKSYNKTYTKKRNYNKKEAVFKATVSRMLKSHDRKMN